MLTALSQQANASACTAEASSLQMTSVLDVVSAPEKKVALGRLGVNDQWASNANAASLNQAFDPMLSHQFWGVSSSAECRKS